MRKGTTDIRLRLYKYLHYFLSIVLFFFSLLFFRYKSIVGVNTGTGFRYNFYASLLYAALLLLFAKTYNAYLLGYCRIRLLAFAQLLAQAISVAIVYFTVSVAWMKFESPMPFLLMLVIDMILDCLWSYYGNQMFYKYYPVKRAIKLYGRDIDPDYDLDIAGKPVEKMIAIEAETECSEDTVSDVLRILPDYDVFFAVGISPVCTNILSCYCQTHNMDGYFVPNIGEVIFQNAFHIQSFHEPVLHVSRKRNKPEYLFMKRVFDIAVSLLGIVVLSPALFVTAIAIKVYDGGPAIYKQKRLTTDGRVFTLLKFRSMRVDAEKDGKAVLSSGSDDDRITPIGKIIRAIRFDELPQLFNILKGDMSVVGPRPERPEIAEQYCETLPEFNLRLQVKAGLTGYAQVYGKYNTSPEQKLKFDLMYINKMSFLTDLQLIFATVEILFSKESTEGVLKQSNRLSVSNEANVSYIHQ